MGLAKYFSRAATAAAHVLEGFDDEAFKTRLKRCTVAVAVDRHAAANQEAIHAVELTVDLLARLYPILAFEALDGAEETKALVARLKKHAVQVNGRIDHKGTVAKASFLLVFGQTIATTQVSKLYIGSDGWTAMLDIEAPPGSGSTDNPFGAATAACVGVANAFRSIFADQLPDPRLDEHLRFNVLSLTHEGSTAARLPDEVAIGEVCLAGVGAIGRASAWALARIPGLAGILHLIDPETIDETNLQRYVWTKEKDEHRSKTETAAGWFAQPKLDVRKHAKPWSAYLAERGDCRIDRVAVALDTTDGRMEVQASLPRRLLNSWTQPGDLGISRHTFIKGPCAVCLYMPTGPQLSLSELVASAVGLPEPEVRELLHAGTKVDRVLAERIAEARGIELEAIRRFINEPLASFYTKAVCGTTIFGRPQGGERGAFAVPMAFQSALAGVLLASEIVADALGLRDKAIEPVSKIDLLRPIGPLVSQPVAKSETGRCICQDPDYVRTYEGKYGLSAAA